MFIGRGGIRSLGTPYSMHRAWRRKERRMYAGGAPGISEVLRKETVFWQSEEYVHSHAREQTGSSNGWRECRKNEKVVVKLTSGSIRYRGGGDVVLAEFEAVGGRA